MKPKQKKGERPFAAALSLPLTKSKFDVRRAFAAAFRNWRLQEKIPLKRMAHDLGVSLNTIHLWETGQRFPSGFRFEQIVNYTGLPPCRLFCIESGKCVPTVCWQLLPKIA